MDSAYYSSDEMEGGYSSFVPLDYGDSLDAEELEVDTCDKVPVEDVTVDTCDVSGVLLALEKAIQMPNFSRADLQNVFKLENWETFRNVYGGDKDPFADNANGQVVDPVWVERLKRSTDQVNDAVKVLRALSGLASQLQDRFKASRKLIIAAKRSKGIKSLPDEIVAKIFHLAVKGDREGGKQAKWISQASRRFRNIAFGTHSLWTNLHSLYSRSDVEMVVHRAGPHTEFHVYVDLNLPPKMRTFVDSCRPIVPRWKTLTLVFNKDRRSFGRDVNAALEELSNLLENGLRLSILEQLFVRSGGIKNAVGTITAKLPGNTQVWAPDLRTLRCSYLLPIPSATLSSISTLVILHSFYSRMSNPSAEDLLKLLIKLPNVSDFTLEAHNLEYPFGDETLPVTDCPSIKSFELRLPYFPLKEFSNDGSSLAALMDALRMPSLEEHSICIGVTSYTGYRTDTESERVKWTQSLGHLSSALLPPHFSISAHKRSLVYKLLFDRFQPELGPPDSKILNIPFDAIVRIPSVSISSFARVLFSQRADEDSHRTLPNGKSQLRELKFIGCGYMTSSNLRSTVDSLKLHGVWGGIERVVVEDCARITREDAMDVIGEERLQYPDGQRSRSMLYDFSDAIDQDSIF